MFLVFCVSMLFCSPICAENRELQISGGVDNEEIYIGDNINANIVVENPGNAEIEFAAVPEQLGDFYFVESKPMEFGWKEKEKRGYVYVMGIYSTGTHVIPPIPVKYRGTDDTVWKTAESPQIPLTVKSTLTGEDKDIKDIKGLIKIGSRYMTLVLFMILLVLSAMGLIFWIKKKNREKSEEEKRRSKPAHEIAYEELDNLKKEDLPGKGKAKEYYIKLSDIVRHYLENRFYFKAPEMTTEEFMEIARKSKELEIGHKEMLDEFLSKCDMVKFAKYGPKPIEMLDSFSSAENFVDQTKKQEEEDTEKE